MEQEAPSARVKWVIFAVTCILGVLTFWLVLFFMFNNDGLFGHKNVDAAVYFGCGGTLSLVALLFMLGWLASLDKTLVLPSLVVSVIISLLLPSILSELS